MSWAAREKYCRYRNVSYNTREPINDLTVNRWSFKLLISFDPFVRWEKTKKVDGWRIGDGGPTPPPPPHPHQHRTSNTGETGQPYPTHPSHQPGARVVTPKTDTGQVLWSWNLDFWSRLGHRYGITQVRCNAICHRILHSHDIPEICSRD